MGGRSQRPNPEDYKPGPAEKMNAAIAKRSNDYFVTKLEPLIISDTCKLIFLYLAANIAAP